jgi:hypothetical protein
MISFGASRLFGKRLRAQFAVDQQQGCENEEAKQHREGRIRERREPRCPTS